MGIEAASDPAWIEAEAPNWHGIARDPACRESSGAPPQFGAGSRSGSRRWLYSGDIGLPFRRRMPAGETAQGIWDRKTRWRPRPDPPDAESAYRPCSLLAGAAGLGVGTASGICTMAAQLGHFPFVPPAAVGVRTGRPQYGHGNSIFPSVGGSPAGRPVGATSVVGRIAPAARWASGERAGMSITAPHRGHFPFLPAALSGVRIRCWQLEQWNSMVT